MTGRDFIRKKLDIIANKITYKVDLHDVVLFHANPLTGLDTRTGYFDDYFEASSFAKNLAASGNYESFICYLDGKVVACNNAGTVYDANLIDEAAKTLLK